MNAIRSKEFKASFLYLYLLIQQDQSSVCLALSCSAVVSISSFNLESLSSCRATVFLSEIIWNSAGLLWAMDSSIASSLYWRKENITEQKYANKDISPFLSHFEPYHFSYTIIVFIIFQFIYNLFSVFTLILVVHFVQVKYSIFIFA